jgi:excisionase family DNA binding protein
MLNDDLFSADTPPANESDWTTRRDVWRVTEIARELGVTARTVRYWIEQGLLEAEATRGGHHRVPARALRRYLNGHPDVLPAQGHVSATSAAA